MTFNSNRKAALAVTAGLVGALTLGGAAVAPQVAFADDAALQFVQPSDAIQGATAYWNFEGDPVSVTHSTADSTIHNVTFQKSKPVTVNVTKIVVSLPGVNPVTVDLSANGADSIEYFERNADGTPGDSVSGEITDAGEYIAKVTVETGTYQGGYVYVPFNVVAQRLDVKVLGEKTFNYDGTVHTVKLYDDANHNGKYDDGEVTLDEGVDYDVQYTVTGHDGTEANAKEVKDADAYVAKFTGKGEYKGSIDYSDVITVNQLDLFSAVRFEPIVTTSESEPQAPEVVWVKQGPSTNERWERHEGDALIKELQAQLRSDPSGDKLFAEDGTYQYVVSPAVAGDENFVNGGTKWFDVSKVKASNLAVFSYNGAEMPTETKVVLAKGEKWDGTKVSAKSTDGKKGYSVEVLYVDGQATGNVNTPGVHTVVYLAKDGAQVVGKSVVKVTVVQDALDADANAYAVYDGKVVTSVEKVYDGKDARDGLSFVVKDNEGNTVDPHYYKVTYYDAEGHEVTKLVNAGTYTAKLTSSTYELSGTTELTITVKKVASAPVKLGAEKTKTWGDKVASNDVKYVQWSSKGYTVEDLDVQADLDGKGFQKLDLKAYKAVILNAKGDQVKKATDEGVYTLHFTGRDTDNYEVPADYAFTVIKNGRDAADRSKKVENHLRFADVRYTDYFKDSVDWAAGEKVMNGYATSDGQAPTFGPYDSLTRAQVAAVLYNLAGAKGSVETKPSFDSEKGFVTGFSDTDGHAWYAEAVAWAKQAGVVNGYGDGTFKPNAPVTREDFACMLANYAKKFGSYEAPAAGALDSMPDGSKVSGYAKSAVAWAVANKVMGNGGFIAPTSTIIRADCAGMVRNFAK